jgi:iron complex transport system permease protein
MIYYYGGMEMLKKIALWASILLLPGFIAAIALSMGPTDVTIFSVINNRSAITAAILLLRLQRVSMAFIVGAALATSGCIFQALLKNPLAEPYTLGVSSGAALGATFAIIFTMNWISAFAFCGALFTIVVIYVIAKKIQFNTTAIILAGISMSFVLSSSVLLLFAFSKPDAIHKALMWLSGDLSMARFEYLQPLGWGMLILIVTALLFHRQLDIISFGTRFAAIHGIGFWQISILFWIASLATSITVAAAGIIGFIGLIIPHAVRLLKTEHFLLIPLSAIAGGTMLVIADTIGRTIVMPYEIPCGIITGFCGGIFFLILLLKQKDSI